MTIHNAAVVAGLGVALVLTGTARAQEPVLPQGEVETVAPASERYGVRSSVLVTLDASDLELYYGTYGGYDATTRGRYCGGSASCGWMGGVQLPAGALLGALELDACDTDPVGEVAFALYKGGKGGAPVSVLIGWGGTGGVATPGCGVFYLPAEAPFETVDNLHDNYFVVVTSGVTSTTRFKALRVAYKLQVSPAPATATFPDDVPTTHPFFRFVEALAAAGITGGCGTGTFCPDNPVTRGQMAVFLATALGLHYPY